MSCAVNSYGLGYCSKSVVCLGGEDVVCLGGGGRTVVCLGGEDCDPKRNQHNL